uniref:Uncharacterized protein LOC114336466 n=1 Tax=Diabrotica virgifera virgifera TaxID=50390 RepID=A0A6P7GEZ8_DIAVI
MKKIVCVFFCLFVAFQLVDGYNRSEIREGNCLHIGPHFYYKEYIYRYGFPFITRSATLTYYGDGKIYCIMAITPRDAPKGSTVRIKKGGLNHTFVELEFTSSKHYGFEYIVEVSARYF